MTHHALFITSLLLVMGCASGSQKTSHQCVAPLEMGLSVDSLNNCTVAAAFCIDNFSWQEGSLDLTAYKEYLYDPVAIHRLQKGDTLLFEGKSIPIDSIEKKDCFVQINGGIERGGVDLTTHESGTYRATTFSDHSVYQEMGTAHLKLADDFVIIDCGEYPTDPCDTITVDQENYLKKLPEHRQDFYQFDTRIRIENGYIKEINRRWIP